MTKMRKAQSLSLPFSIPVIDIPALKNALSLAIKKCPKSREQVADDVSAILRKRVSVDEINSWTAVSKPGHLPRLDELAAFIMATGSPAPNGALAALAGHAVIGRRDADILRLAKLHRERDAAEREMEEISKRLSSDYLNEDRAHARSTDRAK